MKTGPRARHGAYAQMRVDRDGRAMIPSELPDPDPRNESRAERRLVCSFGFLIETANRAECRRLCSD